MSGRPSSAGGIAAVPVPLQPVRVGGIVAEHPAVERFDGASVFGTVAADVCHGHGSRSVTAARALRALSEDSSLLRGRARMAHARGTAGSVDRARCGGALSGRRRRACAAGPARRQTGTPAEAASTLPGAVCGAGRKPGRGDVCGCAGAVGGFVPGSHERARIGLQLGYLTGLWRLFRIELTAGHDGRGHERGGPTRRRGGTGRRRRRAARRQNQDAVVPGRARLARGPGRDHETGRGPSARRRARRARRRPPGAASREGRRVSRRSRSACRPPWPIPRGFCRAGTPSAMSVTRPSLSGQLQAARPGGHRARRQDHRQDEPRRGEKPHGRTPDITPSVYAFGGPTAIGPAGRRAFAPASSRMSARAGIRAAAGGRGAAARASTALRGGRCG